MGSLAIKRKRVYQKEKEKRKRKIVQRKRTKKIKSKSSGPVLIMSEILHHTLHRDHDQTRLSNNKGLDQR